MRPTRILRQKNLLLAFDAFGTLYKPFKPIAEQYADAARRYGIAGVDQPSLKESFETVYRAQMKENPNYGKETGMGPAQWWRNVMTGTFSPFLEPGQQIPKELYDHLLHRFSTGDGYKLYGDVLPFFEYLRRVKSGKTEGYENPWKWDHTVVGVISNSDDRVFGVLKSLGVGVMQPRNEKAKTSPDPDIDFVVLSYDVGVEKPHSKMFETAENMLKETLLERKRNQSIDEFEKLYVGDDLKKDYFGAKAAGWNALLLDRKGRFEESLPNKTSIATVDFKQRKEGGHMGEKVDVIRNLEALPKWVPS